MATPGEGSVTSSPATVPATPEESLKRANSKMEQYGQYIDELSYRYPETFKKLDGFFKRGNCRCSTEQACKCISVGMMCDCAGPKTCAVSPTPPCFTHRLKHKVRVYDIDTTVTDSFDSYIKRWGPDHHGQNYYDAGREDQLEELKINLLNGSIAESKDTQTTHFRLITVSHLSANVAKLLGGIYDIHADFFNRHLPGTEAIAGRLLSRVPSAIQIEFDELYEAHTNFEKAWGVAEMPEGLRGHRLIQDALEQNFLIRQAGWDYFPISEQDWASGRQNTPMSAGFEDTDAENVFQFNLAHRISVYSIPKGHQGHPRTAIILFYPRLDMCTNPAHLQRTVPAPGKPEALVQSHDGQKDRGQCKAVEFRSIPDTVPPMTETTHTRNGIVEPTEQYMYGSAKYQLRNKWDYAAAFHKEFMIHIKKHFPPKQPETDFVHFFGFPLFGIVAANWARLIHKRGLDLDMLEWRPHNDNDTKGSIHTVEETKSRRAALVRHQKSITATLEMLRHLKQQEKTAHFKAEVAGLGDSATNLKELEKIKLKYLDDDHQYNKGLSDGLSGEDADGDTWEALYYDFFELKAGVNALEKRADKIAEGMLAMMNVRIQSSNRDILNASNEIQESSKDILESNKKLTRVNTGILTSARMSDERAGALNWMVAVVSVILGAFTIGDAVYPLNPDSDEVIPTGNKKFWSLWLIVLSVFAVAAVGYLFGMRMIARRNEAKQKAEWIRQGVLPDKDGKYKV